MEREDKTVSAAESMEMKDFGQKNQKDQKVCLLILWCLLIMICETKAIKR